MNTHNEGNIKVGDLVRINDNGAHQGDIGVVVGIKMHLETRKLIALYEILLQESNKTITRVRINNFDDGQIEVISQ